MNVRRHDRVDLQDIVVVGVKGATPAGAFAPHVELDLACFPGGRWALQLDSVFSRSQEPAVIVAQGVACLAVAWWARLSPRSYTRSVRGAVFLSPFAIGFGQHGIAAAARGGPATRLPFPSVIASSSDSLGDQLLALADSWGSQLVEPDAIAGAPPTNRVAPLSEEDAHLIDLIRRLAASSPAVAPQPKPVMVASVAGRRPNP